MLITHSPGHYQFIPGSATFSSGAVALPGYAVVHATFHRPLPLAQAFDAMQAHLAGLSRLMAAVCGIELRSPKPFSFAGFAEFNQTYIALLKRYGLHTEDGRAPAARTNVAPEPVAIAPSQPSVYAFSYTVPQRTERRNFVAAGAGELRPAPKPSASDVNRAVNSGASGRDLIVRVGETTPQAMAEKAEYVMQVLGDELSELDVSWADATAINIYTVHSLDTYLVSHILQPLGETAIHGAHWFYSRPPIEEIEFEMDARGVWQESIL